jgi:hypothetical protein
MKKRIIGILLTLVVATQVFPVDGFRFWSNVFQYKGEVTAVHLMTLGDEEVEEIQFKFKNIESSKAHFYDRFNYISLNQITYGIVAHLGKVIDRNSPILIPPPNTVI